MNKLRIWLAYYIMPKDVRKYLIKALSYYIEELEREVTELFDQMNAEPQESDHKCHTCKHYTSGEHDGSCGSYICKEYSNWESEDKK